MTQFEKSMMLKFSAGMFLSMLLFLIIAVIIYGGGKSPDSYERHTVQSGDSLWSIATQSNGYNRMSTAEIVEDIQERSDCTAAVYPGQIVYIPVYGD